MVQQITRENSTQGKTARDCFSLSNFSALQFFNETCRKTHESILNYLNQLCRFQRKGYVLHALTLDIVFSNLFFPEIWHFNSSVLKFDSTLSIEHPREKTSEKFDILSITSIFQRVYL